MFYFAAAAFINTASSLILGYLIFAKNKKAAINLAFFYYSIAMTIWSASYFFWQISKTEESALLWCKILTIGAIFIPPLYTRFAYRLMGLKENKYFFGLLYLVSSIFLLLSFGNWLVLKVEPKAGFSFWPVAGPGYKFYLLFWGCVVVLSIYLLIREYLKAKGSFKAQLAIVLIGTVIGYAGGATNFPLWYDIRILPWGNITVSFYAVMVAYAIAKHKLLNIKMLLIETIVLITAFGLLVDIIISDNWWQVLIRVAFLVIFAFVGQRLIKNAYELDATNELLKQANTKLQQVDAMKTEFISLASHELLTPISAIEGYLSMMLDEKLVKIDDPKAIQYMQSVYKSAKRLARLVADLLNVSRIEQGRMLVEKKEIDLKELVDGVVKELKFKAQDRHHKLLTSFRPDIDTRTYADEDKIKEVIINLTGNSIKYTNEGGLIGIGIDLWPTSQVEKHFNVMQSELKEHGKTSEGSLQNIVNEKFAKLIGEKQIVIIVKDNGIGISHGDVGRLFQKFSRVGDCMTQEVQGTGLGLYISRALAELHHGRIWAYSEGEGKGSTFYFTLPTLDAEAEIKQLDAQVPVSKDAKPLAKSAA